VGQASRVTFIGSLPPHKGVSPYCLALASALARRQDIDLDVVSFRSLYPARFYPGGSPSEGTAAVDVPGADTVRSLRWWNPFGWLAAGYSLRGDIVHAQWWSFALAPIYLTLLSIARVRGKRVVLTVHNVEPHEGGILRRLTNRAVLPLAHKILVHTNQNAGQLTLSGVSPTRVAVVPMGIGASEVISADARVSARNALGLERDEPLALFLGNIRPYKGLNNLIDAFRLVLAAVPNARLAIVGQPWGPAQKVTQAVSRAGLGSSVISHLRYATADEMRDFYAAADVVVYPYTHFDAQSAAATDALRFGKAILVTRVGGLPDLVDDERAIVTAGDVRELATALSQVMTSTDLRGKLETDSKRIASRSGWDAVAESTARLYDELAGDVRPHARSGVRTGTEAAASRRRRPAELSTIGDPRNRDV
jgi:glycosyltransferase involved in cell wall biosynthesis